MSALSDVEICVRSYEDWAAGGPKLASASWSEDFEYLPPAQLTGALPIRGRDEVIAHLLGVAADTGPIAVAVAEAIPAGEGEVLLRIRTRLEEAGEEPVEGESGHLLAVREGEIIRTRVFLDWDEAREAAGLA